jgi:PAS domain S-box-containing protein
MARVMVVEYEVGGVATIQQFLVDGGHTVVIVSASEAAAQVQVERPALIVVDARDEAGGGARLAVALRALSPVPILLLTGPKEAVAEDAGGFARLAGSFDAAALAAAVQAALDRRASGSPPDCTPRRADEAVIATGADCRIQFVNQAAQRLTGWAAVQAGGRLLEEVLQIADERTHEPVGCPIERAHRTGVRVTREALLLVARDGTRRPIDSSAVTMVDAAGQLLGGMVVFRDTATRAGAASHPALPEPLVRFGVPTCRRAQRSGQSRAVGRFGPDRLSGDDGEGHQDRGRSADRDHGREQVGLVEQLEEALQAFQQVPEDSWRAATVARELRLLSAPELDGPADRPGSSQPPAAATPAREMQRARVLIVDDEVMIGRAIHQALRNLHDVTWVGSALEAVAALRGGAVFDVILCDLLMPGMTGIELYEQLAAEHPAAAERMVFLSGGTFSPLLQEFVDRMPGRHIAKPFSADDLRQAVARQLGRGRAGLA